MNQHLVREASDAALYREQLVEVVEALRHLVDDCTPAPNGSEIFEQSPQPATLRKARAVLAKVSHD